MHKRHLIGWALIAVIGTPVVAEGTPTGDQIGRWMAAADVAQRCPLSDTMRSEAGGVRAKLERWADTGAGPSNTEDARQHQLRVFRLVDNGDPRTNTVCVTALNMLTSAREALSLRGIF